jgi:hypothetical protein
VLIGSGVAADFNRRSSLAVKKLRWVLIVAVLAASKMLCLHPEHWLDNFLCATHLKQCEEAADLSFDSLKPQEQHEQSKQSNMGVQSGGRQPLVWHLSCHRRLPASPGAALQIAFA